MFPKCTRSQAQFKKVDAASADSLVTVGATGNKYRDRAAERRQGVNPDYVDAEKLLASIRGTPLNQEATKFLGGDVAHTHLVKGLDVSLMEQEKKRIVQHPELIPEEPKVKKPQASEWAKTILESAFKKINHFPPSNPHFYPGRMSFLFDLNPKDPFAQPTVILKSGQSQLHTRSFDSEVLAKVIHLLENPIKKASKGNSIGASQNSSKPSVTRTPVATSDAVDIEYVLPFALISMVERKLTTKRFVYVMVHLTYFGCSCF
jgi:hypothetical protein